MPISRQSSALRTIILCLTLFANASAWADFTYRFHWGRIPVAHFDLTPATAERPIIEVKGNTVGLVGKIFQYDGVSKADYSDTQAVVFSIVGIDNDFAEHRSIRFFPDRPAEILDFLDDELERPVDDLVSSMGITVDPLRVVNDLLAISETSLSLAERCQGMYSVFDGKRHYQLSLEPIGYEDIETDRSWSYSGPAYRCDILVSYLKAIGGEELNPWYSNNNEIRTIWLAEIGSQTALVRVSMPGPIGRITGRLELDRTGGLN